MIILLSRYISNKDIDLGEKMSDEIIISNDPGISGGISIIYQNGKIEVYKIPVCNIVVNKKNKKVYDIDEIFNLLKKFKDKNVFYIQEKVGSHPGEGSVSSFGFGKSSGLTIGIAKGLGFEVCEISPSAWKKQFPELVTDGIKQKKEEIKKLRAFDKTLKDKGQKKENKKNIEKLGRQIKSEAKTAARELVSSLYPDISNKFRKKNTDGMAESVLIALYGKNHIDELA